jgi:hypothetical protein
MHEPTADGHAAPGPVAQAVRPSCRQGRGRARASEFASETIPLSFYSDPGLNPGLTGLSREPQTHSTHVATIESVTRAA